MKKLVIAVSIGVVSLANTAHASNLSYCKQFFYKNFAPILNNKKLSKDNHEVCFSNFAVNYSGVSKTALWSAEYVTPESLSRAKKVSREDTFHEETRLPSKVRSLLTDYQRSGYDRGHLVPSANSPSRIDQNQTFSLANIIPQSPKANQENWRKIEEGVRTMVTKYRQPSYVITGPLYLSKRVTKIGKGVLVPSHTYKVVFFPDRGVMSAYVTVNDNIAKTDVVSVAQLQEKSGIVFFPNLQGSKIISQRMKLPLSANAAYKAWDIPVINGQSQIFDVMPDPDALPAVAKKGAQDSAKETAKAAAIQYVETKISRSELANLKNDLENISKVFGK